MNGRVMITRAELGELHERATQILAIIDTVLQRPEPTPPETDDKGWPVLGGPEDPS